MIAIEAFVSIDRFVDDRNQSLCQERRYLGATLPFQHRVGCFSPPPCGEGSGVGVSKQCVRLWLPPSPTLPRKGGGRANDYCVLATRGGVAWVMNWVASSIAVPSGVGTVIR